MTNKLLDKCEDHFRWGDTVHSPLFDRIFLPMLNLGKQTQGCHISNIHTRHLLDYEQFVPFLLEVRRERSGAGEKKKGVPLEVA